ncbi:MAG: LysM peptidoglycan-binding domain-containing protein [Actinomycetota bacterium]
MATIVVGAVLALGVFASPASANSNKPSIGYVVKAGDSLSRIASKAGVSLDALLAVNGFKRSTVILPGQTIALPDAAKAVAAQSVAVQSGAIGDSYTVKAGDSLSRIASKAGVSLDALLAANGFQRTSVIVPGQTIALPAGASVASASAPEAPKPSRVDRVVEFARAQVGKPYQFGSAGPDAYDCSGLVRAAFKQIGIDLPHQSLLQSQRGVAVDWVNDEVRAGDLVFTFSTRNPTQISHVGIAISATEWIEAPFTGAAVRITRLPSDSRIQAVQRIVND